MSDVTRTYSSVVIGAGSGGLTVAIGLAALGRRVEARLALELPTDLVRLDGSRVFAPPTGDLEIDLREWITFAHAREEDGLVFVDEPLKEAIRE